MPRPVYTLCCESESVDAATGLISYFNIFNSLELAEKASIGGNPFQLARMFISSSWMKIDGEDDPSQISGTTKQLDEAPPGGDESLRTLARKLKNSFLGDLPQFEHQHIFRCADAADTILGESKLTFDLPVYRIDTIVHGLPQNLKPGLIYIVSRMRKVGDEKWIEHEYPIFIQTNPTKSPDKP